MDAGSGTTAIDSSGSSKTGTLNGTVAWTTSGEMDALSFSGGILQTCTLHPHFLHHFFLHVLRMD